MSRRRYISTDISLDIRVNKLATCGGDFAVLLYTWMIPHAKDDASLPADAEEILYMVLPGRRDKTVADVDAALDAMAVCGLIVWTDDGLHFPAEAFYRYQTYIQKENRRGDDPPETPDNGDASAKRRKTPQSSDDQRRSAQNAEDRPESAQKAASLNVSPSLSPSKKESAIALSKEKPPMSAEQSEWFEQLWAAYPKSRRFKKSYCRDLWRGFAVDAALFTAIMAGLDAWKACAQWQNAQFIKHVEYWLRDRHWENPPEKPTPIAPKWQNPNLALVPDDMPDERGYVKVILG